MSTQTRSDSDCFFDELVTVISISAVWPCVDCIDILRVRRMKCVGVLRCSGMFHLNPANC